MGRLVSQHDPTPQGAQRCEHTGVDDDPAGPARRRIPQGGRDGRVAGPLTRGSSQHLLIGGRGRGHLDGQPPRPPRQHGSHGGHRAPGLAGGVAAQPGTRIREDDQRGPCTAHAHRVGLEPQGRLTLRLDHGDTNVAGHDQMQRQRRRDRVGIDRRDLPPHRGRDRTVGTGRGGGDDADVAQSQPPRVERHGGQPLRCRRILGQRSGALAVPSGQCLAQGPADLRRLRGGDADRTPRLGRRTAGRDQHQPDGQSDGRPGPEERQAGHPPGATGLCVVSEGLSQGERPRHRASSRGRPRGRLHRGGRRGR